MVGQCFPFCTAVATVAQVHYVLARVPSATIAELSFCMLSDCRMSYRTWAISLVWILPFLVC